MDLFGSVNVHSISGDLCCLVVTDDFTRFSWVVCMERKDQTFESLMVLFKKMETLYKLPIRRIRSDNGTEFKNNRMLEFCYASLLKRVFLLCLGKVIQVPHVDCQKHTSPPQLPGQRFLFDYDKLWESFQLPIQPSDEEIAILYQYQQSMSQEQLPRPLVVSQPTGGSNDHEAGPSGTTHEPPEEPAPTFDNSDDSEEESGPTFDEEPNVESTEAEDHTGDLDITNLQSEVTVPDTTMPRTLSYHLSEQNIGDVQSGVKTRDQINRALTCFYSSVAPLQEEFSLKCFISQIGPRTYKEALTEDSWVNAMHEELQQFEKLGVWRLIDLPENQKLIKTKWVFKCKKDDRGVVVRNKARLVVQGFSQQEGIDYDEVYALVARLEAIRIFLEFASWKDFKVYQLDVKSAFLYEKIKEEVYVGQPPGFTDPLHKKKASNVLFDPLHNSCCDFDEEKNTKLSDFSSILEFMRIVSIQKALTDQHLVYKSHVKRFWKHATYDEKSKVINSVVKQNDEKKSIIVLEALVREVLDFPDDVNSPTKFPERMVKGCML
ncbi:uncharacterized protein LOC118485829 [Helianthus annuus]|uniref:uncharacterized protein LOC118485829 n=1 Tax=Helianthus annuus TaxID=4232 RepID=UPI001652BDCA|nr:uncharacterized protein LOC118485829 [Helianthus annuus]